MKIIEPGCAYELDQLGGGTRILRIRPHGGFNFEDVLRVTIHRSRYLHAVLACVETLDAIAFLDAALCVCAESWLCPTPDFTVVDEGHIYAARQPDGSVDELRFVKRSGGAIRYPTEWPGVQTQEVLRALIAHTDCLQCDGPDGSLAAVADSIREALYRYELRAWRRKQERANRTELAHDDTERPHPWRKEPDGAPFSSRNIESRPVGADGHIIIQEERP